MIYEIGQSVPLEYPSVTGEDLSEPGWYILRVPPMGELPATAWLERKGIKGAWHPTNTKYRPSRTTRKRLPYEAPIASGYLFVPFLQRPIWHEIKRQAVKRIIGVVTECGQPLKVSDDVIAKMKQTPQRIEILRRQEIERRRIKPRDQVDVVDGPLAGWTIEVSRIDRGIAYFVSPLLGGRDVAVPLEKLRKI